MTTEFLFGINEMLSCLSKKAVRNIFFIVTHSKGVDFTPGQVTAPLKEYIKKLNEDKGLDLEFNKNVFCIDNESFRFQVGWSKSEDFRKACKNKIESYEYSWEQSRIAVFNLFKKMYLMTAYKSEETMGVARANTVIQSVIGPLTTVMSLIAKGSSPEYKQQVMDSLMGNGTLNKPDAEPEKLESPQMICTHIDCIKFVINQKTGRKNFDFSNPCHKNCLLRNVVKANAGDPGLKECQIFGLDDICRKCRHSYKFHMHVPFKLNQTTSNVESGKVLNKEEAEKRYKKFYENLASERKTIMSSMITLSNFLQENAIVEYNPAFKERLETEIRTEEASGNHNAVEKLREIVNSYDATVKVITNAKSKTVKTVTMNDVTQTLEKLFTLPLY